MHMTGVNEVCYMTRLELSPEAQEALAGGCYCLAARRLARRITRLYDEKLVGCDLTISQFGQLLLIAENPEITVQDLADAFDLNQSALSRGLQPMQTKGWISSRSHSVDKRKRILSLTTDGLAQVNKASALWKEAQEEVESQNSDQNLVGLAREMTELKFR